MMLAVKKNINFYFYLGSKWLTDGKGDVFGGSFFFFFPILLLSFDFGFLFEILFSTKIPVLVYIIVSCILVLPIYKYYKKDNIGDLIITQYEHTKYNKWYILMLYALIYFIIMFSITFGFIIIMTKICT